MPKKRSKQAKEALQAALDVMDIPAQFKTGEWDEQVNFLIKEDYVLGFQTFQVDDSRPLRIKINHIDPKFVGKDIQRHHVEYWFAPDGKPLNDPYDRPYMPWRGKPITVPCRSTSMITIEFAEPYTAYRFTPQNPEPDQDDFMLFQEFRYAENGIGNHYVGDKTRPTPDGAIHVDDDKPAVDHDRESIIRVVSSLSPEERRRILEGEPPADELPRPDR